MVKTQNVTIRKFDTVSIAKFFALIGFVWGLLAGIIVLAGSLQGYLATGETTLLMSAGLAFVTMILMGVIGGFIGGTVIALAYNRVLRGDHGIRMELDAKV
jgi:hypothetical protein